MRIFIAIALAFSVFSGAASAESLYGDNKIDDMFPVASIEAGQATLSGTPKNLKAGDMLYFTKSPFQFKVKEVKGNTVIIALPERHDLVKGSALLRSAPPMVKKNIDTEAKLKKALED